MNEDWRSLCPRYAAIENAVVSLRVAAVSRYNMVSPLHVTAVLAPRTAAANRTEI